MNICNGEKSQILLSRFYFRTFQVLMVLLLFRGFCIQLSFRDITRCIHEGLVTTFDWLRDMTFRIKSNGARLPLVGDFPYGRGIQQNVGGRGNLRGK